GIVLMAGAGLGMAGAVGVPVMGKLADRYLAESLPASTRQLLERVASKFPTYVVDGRTDVGLGYRQREVAEALTATRAALATDIKSDATAQALRAIVATAIPNEPLVAEANGILQPAEAAGGQKSFRYVAPIGILLVVIFGAMYAADRKRGGYRAVKLEKAAAALLIMLLPSTLDAQQ